MIGNTDRVIRVLLCNVLMGHRSTRSTHIWLHRWIWFFLWCFPFSVMSALLFEELTLFAGLSDVFNVVSYFLSMKMGLHWLNKMGTSSMQYVFMGPHNHGWL